jgi:hypothetical protein
MGSAFALGSMGSGLNDYGGEGVDVSSNCQRTRAQGAEGRSAAELGRAGEQWKRHMVAGYALGDAQRDLGLVGMSSSGMSPKYGNY